MSATACIAQKCPCNCLQALVQYTENAVILVSIRSKYRRSVPGISPVPLIIRIRILCIEALNNKEKCPYYLVLYMHSKNVLFSALYAKCPSDDRNTGAAHRARPHAELAAAQPPLAVVPWVIRVALLRHAPHLALQKRCVLDNRVRTGTRNMFSNLQRLGVQRSYRTRC